MSLRLRLILSVAFVLAISLVIGGAFAGWHAARAVRTEMQAALATAEQTMRIGADDLRGSADLEHELNRLVATLDGNRHIQALLQGSDGALLAASRVAPPATPVPRWFYRVFAADLDPRRIAAPTGPSHSGELVLRSDPTNEVGEVWTEFRDGMLVVAFFCGLTVWLIFWTVGRSLRPLETLATALGRVGGNDYAARLGPQGPPELARLAEGFNAMAGRLAATDAQNRQLHEQLLTLQEEERADLARDLHDEIGPFLFAVNVDALSIHELARAERPDAIAERVQAIRDSVQHMQRHIRSILNRLRPLRPGDIELAAAIGNLVAFWRGRHPEIAFDVAVGAEADEVPDAVRATICRIVQEGLSNAVRHGRPARIEIAVAADGPEICVRVADDGAGLAPAGGAPGFGLVGMQERVAAHAGSLLIENRPGGRGLALTARLSRQDWCGP